MHSIKQVYFDIGGVLLLDFSGTTKWTELRRDLGFAADQDEIFDSIWHKYRHRICLDCDVDIIVADFEIALGKKLANYSLLQDFVSRFESNPSIWPVAAAAKAKYSVGLLTNMYPRMFQTINQHKLLPDIAWDAIVDSSVVGLQKPEPGIYEYAMQAAQVAPESILFIDNSPEHLAAAAQFGWQTLLYDPQHAEVSSREIIERLGLETALYKG